MAADSGKHHTEPQRPWVFRQRRRTVYYFDQTTKTLFELDSFELALILNEGYQVNQSDTLYPYLIHQLEVEASIRGTRSVVRQFAHYDPETNVMFLDMNNGTLLRLDGKKIEVRDNGADNVLFAPVPFAEPWGFVKDVPDDLLTDIIIKPLNFAQTMRGYVNRCVTTSGGDLLSR